MTATWIVVGILVFGVVVATALVWRAARGRRLALQDVPPAMRPGYSDNELEESVQYRYRAWGLVLFVFFALFLPIYWFFESSRINAATEGEFVQAVVRGETLYSANCSQCHGAEGGGGAAATPYGEGSWPAPNLNNIAARYADNSTITDVRDYIILTLERGRPGTPMPVWGAAYGGPLTDQQIEEITDWILANQTGEVEEVQSASASGEDLYTENCVKCHGEEGNGLFVPEEGDPQVRPGPSLIGVLERHSEETILGILRNGINRPPVTMPPWQEGWMYPAARYSDEDLQAIIDYLGELQPAQLPEGAERYSTPGSGGLDGTGSQNDDAATTAALDADGAKG